MAAESKIDHRMLCAFVTALLVRPPVFALSLVYISLIFATRRGSTFRARVDPLPNDPRAAATQQSDVRRLMTIHQLGRKY